MGWEAREVFLEGLGYFGDVVEGVPAGTWDRPSPCAGWTGRDVLGHVGAAVQFGTGLLTGGQPAWEPKDPPGSQVVGDPAAWWDAVATPARQAVSGVDLDDVVEAPGGPRTIGQGLSFPAVDLFVHGWDLARAGGSRVTIPDEVIAFTHELLDGVPPEQLRGGAVFRPEVPVDAGADATSTFVAWTGRDPRWRP